MAGHMMVMRHECDQLLLCLIKILLALSWLLATSLPAHSLPCAVGQSGHIRRDCCQVGPHFLLLEQCGQCLHTEQRGAWGVPATGEGRGGYVDGGMCGYWCIELAGVCMRTQVQLLGLLLCLYRLVYDMVQE